MALTRSIHSDEVRNRIVGAIAGLCSSLHISVIAEGVETIEEVVALRALGIRLFQGYFFARPVMEQLPHIPASLFDAVNAACESALLGEPEPLLRHAR